MSEVNNNNLISEEEKKEENNSTVESDAANESQVIAEINALKEKISQLEKEKEEYLNGWKRAKADFINYKKEEGQRFEEFSKLSLAAIIRELIEVLDSFDLGLSMMKEDDPNYKGMLLIRSKFFDVLKKFGLEEIKVEKGQDFNPLFHEAMLEVENSEFESGKIFEVIEKGYFLNGRVIRPAKVKVVK